MKLALPLLLLAGLCRAADVHYAWLPIMSNIPGVAQTQTEKTQYGVSVMLDSDNPRVTEFQIDIVAKLSGGAVKLLHGVVERSPKAANVTYSTMYSAWVGTSPNFTVMAISVKAVTGVATPQPIPGQDYTEESQN